MGAGVAIGGSVESASHVVVMVDASTGTVRMSDLDADRCTSAVIEDGAGATYGPAVESNGFAYVPILSTGEVVVVRVAEGTVVARASVTGVDRPFDLTVKDGTVWFNESAGAWAGVLGADGVVKRVDKYAEVLVSANNGTGQPGQEQPNPGTNTSGDGGENAGSATNPGGGDTGSQPADGTAGGGNSEATGSNGGATGPTESADLTGLVTDFTYSKRVVEVGESVTFVDRSQGGPIAWTWDFADGSFATGARRRTPGTQSGRTA